jgi:hypothetical protein
MHGGKRPDPMDFWRILEAVFQPELFGIFPDDFRQVTTAKHRQLTGIHRKKSQKVPAGILLPFPRDFRCFPVGYGDFPAYFLQNPAGFGGRNHRPEYLCIIFFM